MVESCEKARRQSVPSEVLRRKKLGDHIRSVDLRLLFRDNWQLQRRFLSTWVSRLPCELEKQAALSFHFPLSANNVCRAMT
uniref:Uncharacterized protein n=1 Tax=Physcomitrium patens TaxID=3218 RepID=A0A2K1ILZ2_PHYPA|nr:hypothetical protein PHYPA_026604 [Physcomitrium patens]